MSRQGTIRRYMLIIEKVSHHHYPRFQEIGNFLSDCGFEVSKRTIERDLEALRNEFGIEITYNHTHRGYFINEELSHDLPEFLRFLEVAATAEIFTESLSDSKETLQYLSFEDSSTMKGIHQLKILLEAAKTHREIEFDHTSFQTLRTLHYRAHPYLLKAYQGRWYLSAYLPEFKQLRTFGIDRMENVKLLTNVFKRQKNLNPRQNFNKVIGLVYDEGKPQNVILSFSAAQGHYVKSLPWHSSQKVLIDNDKECRIAIRVVPNYELIQRILMHHAEVQVIEPTDLREEISSLLKSAWESYQ